MLDPLPEEYSSAMGSKVSKYLRLANKNLAREDDSPIHIHSNIGRQIENEFNNQQLEAAIKDRHKALQLSDARHRGILAYASHDLDNIGV